MDLFSSSGQPGQLGKPIASRIREAIAHKFGSLPAGPVPNSYWLGQGYIELSQFSGKVRLGAVFVMPALRGQGLGSQYLKQVLEMCDVHRLDCTCRAQPFGQVQGDEKSLTVPALKAWYRRHGFVEVIDRRDLLTRPSVLLCMTASATEVH
jgi:GNAT superfamily N-acetyltransferase